MTSYHDDRAEFEAIFEEECHLDIKLFVLPPDYLNTMVLLNELTGSHPSF